MELFEHIRGVIATTRAALADGKITGDEAKAILRELLGLAQDLLGPADTKAAS